MEPSVIDSFINDDNVTISNMEDLINELKKEQAIDKILKKYSLNINLLKKLFIPFLRGKNKTEIAKEVGVHRITIQRYATQLKLMSNEELMEVYKYISNSTKNNKI